MRVVFSDEAKADLEHIGDYIATDSPLRARTFTRELRAKAMQTGATPHAFPLVPRYEHYGIRRRPVGNYLIFYRIDDNQVAIVHVLHGAQDYAAILFPQ